jgi:hypothetical protein
MPQNERGAYRQVSEEVPEVGRVSNNVQYRRKGNSECGSDGCRRLLVRLKPFYLLFYRQFINFWLMCIVEQAGSLDPSRLNDRGHGAKP